MDFILPDERVIVNSLHALDCEIFSFEDITDFLLVRDSPKAVSDRLIS
jgi:hypothetical protein